MSQVGRWSAGGTDIGLQRQANEDAYLADPPLLAVADGLGGHQAGEVASGIAVGTVRARAPRGADAVALAEAVRAANVAILTAAREGRGHGGMGTTLTAAVVEGERMAVAHVGDSRAYVLRSGQLAQLTDDHSVVGEMLREGELTEAEARIHPSRSVITRALGSEADLIVDAFVVDVEPGDRVLLSTDGLHGVLIDRELEEILLREVDAPSAVRALIAAANDRGGPDNVTAVVADIPRPGARSAGRGRRAAARALWLLVAVALVATAGAGTYAYARSRAFVTAEQGQVVVYRGVPGEFVGVELSWLEQRTEIRVDALPALTAERVREGVRVEDLASAMDLVGQYRAMVATDSPQQGD